MKEQKGITLIALVITIIVLLILAGVTIAMLTGENGILTNANNASSANLYYGADEQMKLAYMDVRAEIMARTVANSSYNATTDETYGVSYLAGIVAKDFNTTVGTANSENFKVEVDSTNTNIIKITLTNSKIYAGRIDTNKPSQNGKVVGTITVSAQTASYQFDV